MKDLKKSIIKAVPEIVELKFGCEIEVENHDTIKKYSEPRCRITRTRENETEFWCDNFGNNEWFIQEKDISKIIGRPITLADVLIAARGVNRSVSLVLRSEGTLEEEVDYNSWNEMFSWILEDDNLDNQSPETIEFLKKLLVK